MEHDFIVDEIREIADILEKDPDNVNAVILLQEISDMLSHKHYGDLDVDFASHEEHHDSLPLDGKEDDEQAPVKDPEVQRNKPFSIASFNVYPQGLSFMQMRQDINEWLIPEAEFDEYETAVEYLREQSFAGAVLRTDWDNGVGSIMLITQ